NRYILLDKRLEYVKSRGQEIAEDEAFEVLHCDDNAPTACQLTEAEICSMVLITPKLRYPIARTAKKHKRKTKCQLTA
ncbi:hypothetical protein AVEN_124637-1, partial [Araneus ventricosus]